MTPPKKLPAPKAQNVDVKINTRGTKRAKLDRREKARQDADRLMETAAKAQQGYTDHVATMRDNFELRLSKFEDRFAKRLARMQKRITKLISIADTDPAVAKQEKARAAAAKRMEKLQAKVAELQRVIDGGKGGAS